MQLVMQKPERSAKKGSSRCRNGYARRKNAKLGKKTRDPENGLRRPDRRRRDADRRTSLAISLGELSLRVVQEGDSRGIDSDD
jgi:hypothetical protein